MCAISSKMHNVREKKTNIINIHKREFFFLLLRTTFSFFCCCFGIVRAVFIFTVKSKADVAKIVTHFSSLDDDNDITQRLKRIYGLCLLYAYATE